MTSDQELVELKSTSTAMEAEWLVGALRGFDVSAVTFGDSLTDEFAMSQKLMGLGGGVRVMVPRGELERAREALDEIEQERPPSEELEAALADVGDDHRNDDAESREVSRSADHGKNLALVILSLAVVTLGLTSLSLHEKLRVAEGAPSEFDLTRMRWRGDRWETRWTHNGSLASEYFDRDRNGVSEEIRTYDREGRMYSQSFNENQNEMWELTIAVDGLGVERYRVIDGNENGIDELQEYPIVDGIQERWIDADEDGRYERREFIDVSSGEVLDAFEDQGRKGHVRIE